MFLTRSAAIFLFLAAAGTSALGAQRAATASLSSPGATLDEPFDNVGAIRELRDGRVIVSDVFAKAVYLADFSKNSVTRIGREGQGPKEYMFPRTLLALPADSTLVVDLAQRRFLLLGPDAQPVSTIPFPKEIGPGGNIASDGTGTIYVQASPFGGGDGPMGIDPSKPPPDSVSLLKWDRVRNRVDQLGKVKIPSLNIGVSGGPNARGVMISPQPFAPADDWAVAPDGSIAVVRVGDYHVDWWGNPRAGGPAVAYTAVPVDAREKKAYQDAQRDRRGALRIERGGPGPRGAAPPPEPEMPELDWPEAKPPFVSGTARVAPDGQLWVQRSGRTGEGSRYDVFDRTGKHFREVSLGARSRVVGVTSKWIYVARTDDDELVYLERYTRI